LARGQGGKAVSGEMLAREFRTAPYWIDAAPLSDLKPSEIPARADVAIIGAGYTGLSAALTLARQGRQVLVFDAGLPGDGASTKNAGNVSRTLKKSFPELEHKFGTEKAAAYYREAGNAFEFLKALLVKERIECQAQWDGRFYAAHSPRAYESLARSGDKMREFVGLETEMVSRPQQGRQVGSEKYFGGQIVRGPGLIHAGLLHRGLLRCARDAGARVIPRTRVLDVGAGRTGFAVTTSRNRLEARNVIIATNGYTGREGSLFHYFRRRLIPVVSYVAATEEIAPEHLRRILPGLRPVLDTRTILFHIQPSPDHRRIVIGGHAGRRYRDLRQIARVLHAHYSDLFPDFRDIGISHCWSGVFAFTFDYLPHIGVHEGVHYALGCCGTGVPMGTYLGHKVALRVLGSAEGVTAFEGREFPTVPFYSGNPWFLPGLVRYYSLRDSIMG
jgi:glycine/D-amino acid oxidase-like deaminating enzyme